ncbi:hypothetical protein CPB83DRAFT_840750 [Crepidotus variabilis]|uniref:Uncharacterized protein n=1 Tax=Crepidotus variabilis TaxID=179855 RepID=A0A9P6JI75_9AGAR|nr:hypothetical protein CPB83DRAFT_840750 [Crepidotus variabilis]
MPTLAKQPAHKTVDLSADYGAEAKNVDIIAIPFPKNTIATVFGQMTAEWEQCFNSYILDLNYIVVGTQAVWDAKSNGTRFQVTATQPTGVAPPDPTVFNFGPFNEDRYVGIYCAHIDPTSSKLVWSSTKEQHYTFQIGSKNAIAFTMVNAEDGGDEDYHDTVVGVAVSFLTK